MRKRKRIRHRIGAPGVRWNDTRSEEVVCMMQKRCCNPWFCDFNPLLLVFFGAGLLIGLLFPLMPILFLLAVIIIAAGCALGKHR